jgi:23S rRNA-/tRNA-specific pseudouridylate synthase
VINTNIGQHAGRNQYGTDKLKNEGGKSALTAYKVNAVLAKGQASIITCQPKTGRSHQIRVHLSSIDCPILGDKIYSNKFKYSQLFQIAGRQMLHASQLKFEIWGQEYNLHAPAPADFNQMAKYIKNLPVETQKRF